MTKTRKMISAFLGAVLLVCVAIAGSLLYEGTTTQVGVNEALYGEVQDTLADYVNDGTRTVKGDKRAASYDDPSKLGRFTQRVTILSDGEILPISGTVTKSQDDFYPGTYEIKFSSNAILTTDATIYVDVDVKAGDTIYVLIGDKDKGYTEFTKVVAEKDNKISFETNIVQDYTISTTDIKSAQEAMASVFTD